MKRMWICSSRTATACALSLFAVAPAAFGQALDPGAVEAFFDGEWAKTLSNDGIVPGAVITVVQGGELVLNKGYGVRDIDTGEPVDPDATRVRIGSTSKLFSALTVLALFDEGKLELDRDVNDYLTQVKVPETYAEPVTLRTLLSHRSGFDAGISGYMAYDNNDIETPPDVYQRRLIRVRPPNREYGYDNLGLGVMGYIAGQVNETTFARAVEEKVTLPLGMRKTTMGVPDWQLAELAGCHSWDADGELVKCTPKFMRAEFAAAGDVTTTGSDMARFMIALLNDGCIDMKCVLEPVTFAQFSDMGMNRLHPLAKGMGYIMYEKEFAGRFAMGHDGGQDGFSTTMTIFPESGTGVFISQFSYGGIPEEWDLLTVVDFFTRGTLHFAYAKANEVQQRFAEAFLPEPVPQPAAKLTDIAADSALDFLEGKYVGTRQAGAMLLDRFLRVAAVTAVGVDGSEITVGGKGPYRHTGGGVLEMAGEEAKWLLTRTEHDIFLQSTAGAPVDMLVQRPWHWDARITVVPLIVSMLLAIPALVFGYVKRSAMAGRNVGYLLAFVGVAVLVGLFLELQYFAANYFPEGSTAALVAWRLLLNLAWVAALASLYLIVVNRREMLALGGIAASSRAVLVALFALSAAAVVILLPYWGLLGNFAGI